MIPIIMEQRHDALRIRELIRIYLLIIGYTLATCAFFIVVWFHSDASMYYRYFFGFFSAKSPLPPCSAPFQTMIHYVRTPAAIAFLIFGNERGIANDIKKRDGSQATLGIRSMRT